MAPENGRPKMCPSCGKLMGIARICPYCGADSQAIGTRLKSAGRAASVPASAADGHGMPVTFVLVLIMVGIFVASIAFGGTAESSGAMSLFSPTTDTQVRLGAMLPGLVKDGEWWRLVTANFLHGGVLHLLMNCLAIWVIGKAYEDEVGPAPMLGLFLLSCFGGFTLSFLLGPEHRLVVGASAGAFGLVGAVIGRRRLLDGNFRDRRTLQAIQLAALNIIITLGMNVDNYAHVGGLLVGAVVAYLQARFERKALVWSGIAAATALISVTSFAFALTTPALPRFNEVSRALNCRNMLTEAVSLETDSPNLEPASRMLDCLEKVPPMEGEGGARVEAMKKGLRRAMSGRQKGALSDERGGVKDLYEAAIGFDRWVRGWADRLGYGLSDKP
ncbi:MAG: rhomboid family intramembrane serine protease [Myxococcota bacterium]